jgi:hypothetical protein
MNERIRELKEQAWTLVSNEERARGELYEAREQWERCDQKFAELIVKECAESLWTEECYNSDLALEEFQKNSKKIREHFGVEE